MPRSNARSAPIGNTPPTVASVMEKLERPGSLFASDEVRVLVFEIEKLRHHLREIQRKYVRTNRA